jgi:pullulanase/glycogen debranching enzyme
VAGDQLKAASHLAVPVVGVGLLYQQGYFRQVIDKRGGQQALYTYKHNEANGENNHDGTDANFSENYGFEGETSDTGMETLRKRQIKNLLPTLSISRGVPMLLGGDEFRRTQGGNNNAYCQPVGLTGAVWNGTRRSTGLLAAWSHFVERIRC